MLLICFLLAAARAQEPTEPAAAPAAERGAAEARVVLVIPVGELGPGPALDLSASFPVTPWLGVGPAVVGQLPTATSGTLDDPALSSPMEWTSREHLLAAVARAEATLGGRDGIHGRIGLDVGLAGLWLRTEDVAGEARERALAACVSLHGGPLLPLGPGQVTGDLGLRMTPAEFLVPLERPAVTLGAGYRLPW